MIRMEGTCAAMKGNKRKYLYEMAEVIPDNVLLAIEYYRTTSLWKV